jgi:hypothetical protein
MRRASDDAPRLGEAGVTEQSEARMLATRDPLDVVESGATSVGR